MKDQITQENNNIIIETSKPPFQMLSHQISRNKKLSDGAKSLYIYLNSHNEQFTLSYQKIATFFNVSIDKIKRNIKELKKAGFIIIEKIPQTNNHKYICLDTPSNKDYLLQESLKNGDLMTIFNNIENILNDKTITQDTKNQVLKELQRILNTKWINKPNE